MAPSSSSSSSSSGGSHAGLAIAATAMALSGTLVLYSLCRANKQPQLVPSDSDAVPSPRLRPCLSSSGKCPPSVPSWFLPPPPRRGVVRVREFVTVRVACREAEEEEAGDGAAREPAEAGALRGRRRGQGQQWLCRRRHRGDRAIVVAAAAPREEAEAEPSCAAALRTPMPANREALYRGMLRGRTMLRVACSY
jgi:hypothetical protein